MAASRAPSWTPDWIVTPGEVLIEALQERDMSQAELARRMARPLKTISEIANGKAAITPETAIQFERALGIRASFWNGLEAQYREAVAHQRAERELESYGTWLNAFPVADMVRRGLLPRRSTLRERVAEMLAYFRVSSPSGWQQQWGKPAVSYRRSRAHPSSPHALAAWLRWGDLEAEKLAVARFSEPDVRKAVEVARRLTRQAGFGLAIDRIRDLFAAAGVAFIVLPESAVLGSAERLDG